MGADPDEVDVEYFGLNHLGWIKNVSYQLQEKLPDLIEIISRMGNAPGLPFEVELITSLGMIPNEYLYYYYYAQQAVDHILAARESRGEQIARENLILFSNLKEKFSRQDFDGMYAAYQLYLDQRGRSYMVSETGRSHDLSSVSPEISKSLSSDEGYAGVALNLIEALSGKRDRMLILNVPNNNSIDFMQEKDVVEIPAIVSWDKIRPMPVGVLPDHSIGLMLQVKHYEHLTIEAAMEHSYQKARLALTAHPLVRDYELAGIILDEYIAMHKGYFPNLQ